MSIEDVLLREEGFIPYAYQDSLGYWTIGIGTLIDKRGGGISKAAAVFMMAEEVAAIRQALDGRIPWWQALNEVRREVLMSMAYQLGVNGLLKFTRTLGCVEQGDYGGAATGMLASRWASQTPNRARRAAEAMRTGRWA